MFCKTNSLCLTVEIISAPPPPKISKSSHHRTPPPPEISSHKRSSPPSSNNQEKLSLSIDETNKLRAKLGLKPLEVSSDKPRNKDNKDGKKEDPVYKDDLGEFHHKPAVSITQKNEREKFKEKLSTYKEKRQIDQKLNAVKTLGDSDSEDDASAWVKKSRQIEIEKRKAEERVSSTPT